MADIRWENPPPRGGAPVYDWAAIAAALKSRPGTWARVAAAPNSQTAGQMARHIRNGYYKPLASGFDATARTVDGEARVFARYLGEVGDDD